ncbi:MAG: hypothetical protein ABR588_10545 [Sphingomicrobium sp.]
MDDPRQHDMFGHPAPQGEMFDAPPAIGQPIYSEKYGWIEPPPPGGHTRDTIRARMHRLIAEARAAETVPWPVRRVRSNMVMFPYMAEWLPKDEGEQLLMEFRAEMKRLGHDAPPPLDL